MELPALCTTSCAIPTAKEFSHSAMGMLHPHRNATCVLYVTLRCPISPTPWDTVSIGKLINTSVYIQCISKHPYWFFCWLLMYNPTSHTHTQLFHCSLDSDWDNPGEPLPEETFTYSHLSWSSVIPYLLPLSIMINGILIVQFTCLRVFFHNLYPSFLWSTSSPGTLNFIHHTFLHPIIVFFSQHMPIPSQPVLL